MRNRKQDTWNIAVGHRFFAGGGGVGVYSYV